MTQPFRSDQTSGPPLARSANSPNTILNNGWAVASDVDESTGNISADTSGQSASSEPFRRENPGRWPTQIRDLGDERYQLNEAVMVIFEQYPDDEVIIARYPEVEAFGEGETETDALLQLKVDIVRLYEELLSDDLETLGPLPQAWRRILSKLVIKV